MNEQQQHARRLALTIDHAYELERVELAEARAIACGALALLAEATGLSTLETVATALKILADVRRGAQLRAGVFELEDEDDLPAAHRDD